MAETTKCRVGATTVFVFKGPFAVEVKTVLNSRDYFFKGRYPVTTLVLSLLWPGLGQIYCLQDNKGVFLAGMTMLGCWLSGSLTNWVMWPLCAWDAWLIAKKINSKVKPARWEFFPTIKFLNTLPTRIILFAVIFLTAALTLAHLVSYGSDYHPAP